MTQKNQIDLTTKTNSNLYSPDQRDDEIHLIDLIYPIYKRRRFLILFCFIIIAATMIITILSSKTYEAAAVLLPEPKESDSGVGGELKAAFLQQFGIAGIGGSSPATADVFEAVLKSRNLAFEALNRYNYFYIMGINKKYQEKITGAFATAIEVTKDRDKPTLLIKMQSHDPRMAADLVNTYIVELDRYNRTNAVTSAQRLRQYIEERLKAVNKELVDAQKELREFQEKNRAVSIDKQTEATLVVLAEMEAQRLALEVQKAAKERFYKGPHIEIEQLEAQINALQKNIDRLTYSQEPQVPVESEKGIVEFYIPLKRIPVLNFEESRLLLNVKTKTGVITMLTTQLEQAKLDETKDMPTINVLDWAKPPERPINPRLKLNVLLGFIVSIFLGVFIIFLLEFIHRMGQDPEASPKWQEMKKGFKLFKKSKPSKSRTSND